MLYLAMQKKTLSYTPQEISFECVEKDTVYKDNDLSDHIVAWHKNNLSENEKVIIDQVIHLSNQAPVESCNNCLSCESGVFKHSYASALETMLTIKQTYEAISYNTMNDRFILDLKRFQQKIDQPNVIHIYDTKIVNNSYLEPLLKEYLMSMGMINLI